MTPDPARPRLNVLVAYPYVTKEIVAGIAETGADCRWLLDSGAFTAFKVGKDIRLDDYCRFIDALPVKPWRYFALDVIGNPAATRRNYLAMLDRGYRPVPIFTRGESLDEMDRLYETSDVVGIGGVAGADKSAYAFVKRVMQHTAGRKVHILGFTAMDWLKFLRPYSVDSSSWEAGARYGQGTVYLGHGRFGRVCKADMAQPLKPVIRDGILRLGFDPHALRFREAWHGDHSAARWLGAASWIRASIDIERNLGTLLFVALAANRFDLLQGAFLSVTGRDNGEALRQATLARKRKAA